MRMAVIVSCIVAVTFLLRVLVALISEAMTQPRNVRVYLSKFSPSKRRSELIVMSPESQQRKYYRSGDRIALVVLATVGLLAIGLISGEPLCKTLFG